MPTKMEQNSNDEELIKSLRTALNNAYQRNLNLVRHLSAASLKIANLEQKVQKHLVESETDCMTGLLNRRGWEKLVTRLDTSSRSDEKTKVAVIYIDLDELKIVNDTQGHEAGDRMIVSAAKAIKNSIRRDSEASRIGGDEFTIVVYNCSSEDKMKLVMARVSNELAKSGINAAIGGCLITEADDFSHACRIADQRMYQSKVD